MSTTPEPVGRMVYNRLYDEARRRDLAVELHAGPPEGEKGKEYRSLSLLRVVKPGKPSNRVIAEVKVRNDDLDAAASGCLTQMGATG